MSWTGPVATERTTVVAIAQQKGGAGTTTLALQLATALHALGHAVCLVDIDPQGSLSRWFELRQRRRDPEDALVLVKAGGWRLSIELDRLRGQFRWVIIDTPPHAESDARTALRLADQVLVPCQPSLLDVWASQPTLEAAVREGRRPVIVWNRVPSRGRAIDEARAALAETGVEGLPTGLGNRQAFIACVGQGQGVVEHEPRSAAAEEARALAGELERRARRAA
jgi:chromosome partitioning protein